MRAGVIGIPTGAIDLVPRGEAATQAASPTRILTAARLDGEADPDRAAVASGPHHDAGLPVDVAIARASETSTG